MVDADVSAQRMRRTDKRAPLTRRRSVIPNPLGSSQESALQSSPVLEGSDRWRAIVMW